MKKLLLAFALVLLGPTAFAATVQGEVLEVRDAAPYTYLRLKTGTGETWAAVTAAPVKKGEQVTIANAMVMENFESKSLKKTFDKLADSESSSTLKHQALTLEFTSQPAWYAIQALPYMMEYPYECSEQIFSRYYANSIASHIANSDPRVKTVFERWKTDAENALKNKQDKGALFSNLEKNQDLKYLLLQETPWVMAAKNETERKQRLAVFLI